MPSQLSPAELVAEAERRTGLSDWGQDDFRSPLAALVESAESEAGLSALGRRRLGTWLGHRLDQRLRMIEDRRRIPEIPAQVIDRPIAIMGLPRAGTTYLHRLMSLHESSLATDHWQIYFTSPPPNAPGTDRAAGIAAMKRFMADQGWFAPEIMAAHTMDAEQPEEDIFLFENSMVSMYFTGYLEVPGYLQYVFQRGFADAFRWHRYGLQAIQYGTQGKRWMLKAPGYTVFCDPLLAEYPDITLIQNHRDPAKVIASTLKVLVMNRATMSDRPLLMGRDEGMAFMEMYAQGLMQAAARRDEPAFAGRFLDVHFRDLENDPIGTVKAAFAHADLEFTPHAAARIEQWIAGNRKGQHGKHKYDLAEFGLTTADVHHVFGDYMARFGIVPESV